MAATDHGAAQRARWELCGATPAPPRPVSAINAAPLQQPTDASQACWLAASEHGTAPATRSPLHTVSVAEPAAPAYPDALSEWGCNHRVASGRCGWIRPSCFPCLCLPGHRPLFGATQARTVATPLLQTHKRKPANGNKIASSKRPPTSASWTNRRTDHTFPSHLHGKRIPVTERSPRLRFMDKQAHQIHTPIHRYWVPNTIIETLANPHLHG